MDEIPVMAARLSKDLNREIDNAVDVVRRGEVYIGFFGVNELMDQWRPIGVAPSGHDRDQIQPTSEMIRRWMTEFGDRIADVLTPERSAAARDRLKHAIEDPEFRKILPLLVFLLDELGKDELHETTKLHLVAVALGELRVISSRASSAKALSSSAHKALVDRQMDGPAILSLARSHSDPLEKPWQPDQERSAVPTPHLRAR